MNKISFIAMKIAITIVLFALSASLASATVSSVYSEVTENDLKNRIENLQSQVDLRYTAEVHTIIDTYIKSYRRGAEKMLGLSEQFFPLYEAELNKQGLPEELKYLSIVESGLRPKAVSVAGAVGLWQFMKGTGRLYGLRINDVVDERKDPIRSTQAASHYLKDLHEQFGDWTLALAAYNCGPGNVRKAIRRSQEDKFWNLKGYLPKETRRYIPKYVAISYVMNYSHVHDLYPIEEEVNSLSTVKVYDYTTFTKISKVTGLDKATIAKYNPSYSKWYIPKSSKGYYLTLPQNDLYYYLSQVGGFENLLDLGYDHKTLKGRYMLFGAMKEQVVNLSTLPTLHQVSFVKASQQNSPENPVKIELTKEVIPMIDKRSTKKYRLKPNESLVDVAKERQISLSTLIKLNDIDLNQPPGPGVEIRLP